MSETKDTIFNLSKKLEAAAMDGISYAQKKSADRSKIATSCSVEKRLVVENGEFTLANTLESQRIGIGVHKDQKKGSASLNSADGQGVRQCVDDALSIANFSVADEFLVMPDVQEAPPAKALSFLWDDKTSFLSLADLQEFTQVLLGRLSKDKRVSLDRLEVATTCSWSGLYNSLGVRQSETQSAISWSFMGMAVDGDEVSGFDYDGRSVYQFDGAAALALSQCDDFVEKVIGNLKPIKSPSYRGSVLLTPRAVEEILLGTVLYHASGASVMDGKSLWANKIGDKVISPLITLTDHPHSPRFSGATAFDMDGIPTKVQPIIELGILKTHLHDCYSAKRCGARSTATAGGPFALVWSSGNSELQAMRDSRQELLVVDRFSGNIDPIKGDFSGVAKSSRLLRNGADQGSVTETMIAGNLFECLTSVLAVSRDVVEVSGSIQLPWILVDGVSVTGN